MEKGNNIKVEMENALKNAEHVDGNINKYIDQIKLMEEQQDILENQHEVDLQRIEKLENENRIMTDNLLKKAKSNKNFERSSQEEYQPKRTEEHKHPPDIIKSKSGNNIIINPTGPRTLTKKMMRDIMEEVYESKIKYDKACEDNKIAYETLEQHMYNYLNHKYGLKVNKIPNILESSDRVGYKHYQRN